MAYLASLPLNPLRSGTQQLLTNPQRMHAAVEGCLPPSRSGRLLWRLERRPHELELLLLSPDIPTLDHLIEQAGWPNNDAGAGRIADVTPLLSQVAVGRQFAFRAQLNPSSATRHVQSPTSGQTARLDQERAARIGHRTVASQLEWFWQRATGTSGQWGFAVGPDSESANVAIVKRGHLSFSKGRNQPAVSLDVATYEGVLTVTDRALFTDSLLNGIGKAKAYGCGLLTLAPAR